MNNNASDDKKKEVRPRLNNDQEIEREHINNNLYHCKQM